jgi:CBS domain-containing protein
MLSSEILGGLEALDKNKLAAQNASIRGEVNSVGSFSWREKTKIVPRLGWMLGVRLRLHPTWAIAFLLIIAIVVTQFPEAYPFWQRIILGVAASLLFFVAVSIREVTLNFLALHRGIPVKRVTLFAFGGVSQIAKEDTLPVLELLLAAAGLLTNLVIAGIFYAIHSILVNTGSVVIDGLILWLAYMYFMLALFHFIPAFPLDVGRLLRMLLWKATGDYDRATRIASWTGQGIGLLLIVGGILLLVLAYQWFNGLALIFVGWILYIAAVQSRRQTVQHEALQRIMARDVMTRECPVVTQQLTLGQLVRDCILVTGQRYFVVADGGKLQGVVTMRDIKRVPKKRRDSTPISEIMTPASELKTAHAQQSAASLLEQMDELGISQIPVLEQDKVIGIVARDSLIRLNKTRGELRM